MTSNFDGQTAAERYGVDETNGLTDGAAYHGGVNYGERLSLRQVADRGGRISRLRILQEGPYADISYCHATLPDGSVHDVLLGQGARGARRWELKRNLIEWAKEEGVFAKAVGLLDEANWSVLS